MPESREDNPNIARSGPNRDAVPEGTVTDERLARLVRLLTNHATLVVSGTKIADELKISRSEVWRLVEVLRELGVAIEGHPATGYQLSAIPDLLLPDALRPLLKGTLFANAIHHYFRIGSTNVAAMQAGAAGEPEGAVFLAEEQTAGKGRGGHSWHSVESAGIYCSILLRPRVAPADALILALAAGVATADAVRNITELNLEGIDMSGDPYQVAARATDDLEKQEEIARVLKALDTLPTDQKEVIVLGVFQDLSYAEMEEITGTKAVTLRSRMFHGLKRLGRQVGGPGADDGEEQE